MEAMQKIQYVTYCEGDYVVARGLNLEISSFGSTEEDAAQNFQEAVALYFEDSVVEALTPATDIRAREFAINA